MRTIAVWLCARRRHTSTELLLLCAEKCVSFHTEVVGTVQKQGSVHTKLSSIQSWSPLSLLRICVSGGVCLCVTVLPFHPSTSFLTPPPASPLYLPRLCCIVFLSTTSPTTLSSPLDHFPASLLCASAKEEEASAALILTQPWPRLASGPLWHRSARHRGSNSASSAQRRFAVSSHTKPSISTPLPRLCVIEHGIFLTLACPLLVPWLS